MIGNGSFGVVYQAKLCETGEMVAIKKVLQDKRFKNRELQIMRRLEHCNIVKLMYFFYTSGEKKDEIYLNLVLEFIPETVYKVARQYSKSKQTIPVTFIKLYMYQLFRSLAYIHSQVNLSVDIICSVCTSNLNSAHTNIILIKNKLLPDIFLPYPMPIFKLFKQNFIYWTGNPFWSYKFISGPMKIFGSLN